MGIFTQVEWELMRVRFHPQPACIGKIRKLVEGNNNWDIYWNPYGWCESIAKPGSGAANSGFGNICHVKRLLEDGKIRPSQLTKLGRRMLGVM